MARCGVGATVLGDAEELHASRGNVAFRFPRSALHLERCGIQVRRMECEGAVFDELLGARRVRVSRLGVDLFE